MVYLLLLILFRISYLYAGWQIETIDSDGDCGWGCDIALDPNNRPHISYIQRYDTTGLVKYAYFDGTNWGKETVCSINRCYDDWYTNYTSIE